MGRRLQVCTDHFHLSNKGNSEACAALSRVSFRTLDILEVLFPLIRTIDIGDRPALVEYLKGL